jgi:hypothetical protein
MLPVCAFVGTLAIAGKLFKKIEETVKTINANKSLKKTLAV